MAKVTPHSYYLIYPNPKRIVVTTLHFIPVIGLVVAGVQVGTCSVTCPVDGQDFVVRARPFNCNPKTAEQWAALGCIFANPSATTSFGLSTHNRVTPTTSCDVSCPTDGEDFVVTRVTGEFLKDESRGSKMYFICDSTSSTAAGLTAITDDNIHDAADEWVAQPAAAGTKYGHISWWDTQLVTDMSHLFLSKSTFNDDLSHW